jgi:hypothetical protein
MSHCRHAGLTALVLAIAAASGPAIGDDCKARFVKVMTDRSQAGASRSHFTTVTSGQKPMVSINHKAANGDWMTEMVEPAGIPWSLGVGTVLYASTDKGRSWTKVRDMTDPGHDPEAVRRDVADAVAAATNVVCGTEELGGARHEKLEADVAYPKMGMTVRQALWVHADTRRVMKSWQRLRMGGTETEITETLEHLPELMLPRPQ